MSKSVSGVASGSLGRLFGIFRRLEARGVRSWRFGERMGEEGLCVYGLDITFSPSLGVVAREQIKDQLTEP